jgi:putative hydrolase of the HAD superfamily
VSGRLQAVVTDFGGVMTTPLVDAFAGFQDHARLPLPALGAAMAAITAREGRNPLHELEVGGITEKAFLDEIAAQLERDLEREVDLREFTEVLWRGMRPNDEVLAFLREARADGLRLALLTNNVREWEHRWRSAWPIDELFEVVVDSAFVGVRKPDAAIYEILLERLGLPAEACLFLDDLEPNVAAAARLGFAAVHFRTTEQALAEARALLAA